MWIYSDGKPMDKQLLQMLRFNGENYADIRKNLSNAFSGKHKPSKTTIAGINRCCLSIIKNEDEEAFRSLIQHMSVEDFDKPVSLLQIRELGYETVFKAAKIESGFTYHEIKRLLELLREVSVQKFECKADDNQVRNLLFSDNLLAELQVEKFPYRQITSLGEYQDTFSAELLLYFWMSIIFELNKDSSVLPSIIGTMLQDVENKQLKTAFAYFTDLWKQHHGITVDEMAKLFINCKTKINKKGKEKKLDEYDKVLDKYRNGTRGLTNEDLKLVLDCNANLFVIIQFWRNFINRFVCEANGNHEDIVKGLKRGCSEFPAIVESRFQAFSGII